MKSANIFLIGLMGAGKTTTGKQIAQHTGQTFYDSDHIICERTGVSIPTIFELEGERGFRQREAAVIEELTALPDIVLATGGGAPLNPTSRHHLQNRGLVIYLHARPDILFERIRTDKNRPLLQVADPPATLHTLYVERDPIYRSSAHLIIDSSHSDNKHTLQHILRHLPNKG